MSETRVERGFRFEIFYYLILHSPSVVPIHYNPYLLNNFCASQGGEWQHTQWGAPEGPLGRGNFVPFYPL